MCQWLGTDDNSGTCSLMPFTADFVTMLYVAIFSGIVSLPFSSWTDYVIMKILRAKMKKYSPKDMNFGIRWLVRDPELFAKVELELSEFFSAFESFRDQLAGKKRQEFDGSINFSYIVLVIIINIVIINNFYER
jgi:hypothetical protein